MTQIRTTYIFFFDPSDRCCSSYISKYSNSKLVRSLTIKQDEILRSRQNCVQWEHLFRPAFYVIIVEMLWFKHLDDLFGSKIGSEQKSVWCSTKLINFEHNRTHGFSMTFRCSHAPRFQQSMIYGGLDNIKIFFRTEN